MNLAYVAGLFDGEGCVNFTKCRNTRIPRVFITNTNLEVLESLKERFGGYIQKATRHNLSWKQGYHWTISNSKALDFLLAIEKWVRIKKEQIWLVSAWDAIRPGYNKPWDEERLSGMELINAQSKWLNWKGSNRPEKSPIDQVLEEIK